MLFFILYYMGRCTGESPLVINREAMRLEDDHRGADVKVCAEVYDALHAVQGSLAGVLDEAIVKTGIPYQQNVVKIGKNICYGEGDCSGNPDPESGDRAGKIRRLAGEISAKLIESKPFSNLIGGIARLTKHGKVGIKELIKAGALSSEYGHADDGERFNPVDVFVSRDECKRLRLSYDDVDLEKNESRLAFLQELVFEIDLRLRSEFFTKNGNSNPIIERKIEPKFHGDHESWENLYLRPEYCFDNHGLSVKIDTVSRDVLPSEYCPRNIPGSKLYFELSNGKAEVIPLSIHGNKFEFDDVEPFVIERNGQVPLY